MHSVAPIKRPIVRPTHRHAVPPLPRVVAIIQRNLLLDAVLDRRAPNGRFPVLVAFEDILEFLLVGFGFGFDGGEGSVGGPEVGVAAVGVERFGGDDGFCGVGCWGFGGLGGGGGFLGWSWGRRRGGRVFYGGFFGEEVPEAGVEVAEGIAV